VKQQTNKELQEIVEDYESAVIHVSNIKLPDFKTGEELLEKLELMDKLKELSRNIVLK
jgi:hypothetical protein